MYTCTIDGLIILNSLIISLIIISRNLEKYRNYLKKLFLGTGESEMDISNENSKYIRNQHFTFSLD